MKRREFLASFAAFIAGAQPLAAAGANGPRLAAAARAQIGVTTSYDPTWMAIPYPNGDVPRSTGVCADVVIRAARDGLGLDLQKLVHKDMAKNFDAYPARKAWGQKRTDTNIDHRRVLNLQAYFQRAGAQLWLAAKPAAGDGFPPPIEAGDILTWLLVSGQTHIGMVAGTDPLLGMQVIHNIGRGVEQTPLAAFRPNHAVGHYRWPA